MAECFNRDGREDDIRWHHDQQVVLVFSSFDISFEPAQIQSLVLWFSESYLLSSVDIESHRQLVPSQPVIGAEVPASATACARGDILPLAGW